MKLDKNSEDVLFWGDAHRAAQTPILTAWMAEVLHLQNKIKRGELASSQSGVAAIANIFQRGPRFRGFDEGFARPPSAVPMVGKSYLLLVESRQAQDKEIVRLITGLRHAKQLFFRAMAIGDKELIQEGFDTIFGKTPRKTSEQRKITYDWAERCQSAGEVILSAWRNSVEEFFMMENTRDSKEVVDMSINGPRLREKLLGEIVR